MKIIINVDKKQHEISTEFVKRFQALEINLDAAEALDKLFRKLVVDAEVNAEKRKMEQQLGELQRKKLEEAEL